MQSFRPDRVVNCCLLGYSMVGLLHKFPPHKQRDSVVHWESFTTPTESERLGRCRNWIGRLSLFQPACRLPEVLQVSDSTTQAAGTSHPRIGGFSRRRDDFALSQKMLHNLVSDPNRRIHKVFLHENFHHGVSESLIS